MQVSKKLKNNRAEAVTRLTKSLAALEETPSQQELAQKKRAEKERAEKDCPAGQLVRGSSSGAPGRCRPSRSTSADRVAISEPAVPHAVRTRRSFN